MVAKVDDLQITLATKKFQELCDSYAEGTENIRTFKGVWGTGVYRVPQKLRDEIGSTIRFIQDKIINTSFCTKNECLIIYNFQPSTIEFPETVSPFYVLKMCKVAKSEIGNCKSFIEETGKKITTVQLMIDENGNIVNANFVLEMLGYLDEDDARKDPPRWYGNYYYPDAHSPDLSSYSIVDEYTNSSKRSLLVDTAILSTCVEEDDVYDLSPNLTQKLIELESIFAFSHCQGTTVVEKTKVSKLVSQSLESVQEGYEILLSSLKPVIFHFPITGSPEISVAKHTPSPIDLVERQREKPARYSLTSLNT